MTRLAGPASPETELFRRVSPDQVVVDETRRCLRMSSAAFRQAEMSIYLQDELASARREPASVIETAAHRNHFLAAVRVRVALDLFLEVRRSPGDDEAHGDVVGKKSSHQRDKKLSRAARWIVAPTHACREDLHETLPVSFRPAPPDPLTHLQSLLARAQK